MEKRKKDLGDGIAVMDCHTMLPIAIGTCGSVEIATGKILWVEELGKQYSSSVLANGFAYMPNDQGVITVIKSGPTFEAVARNSIGERMNASPAISNGKIYLRGDKHLFCIGNK
ncbi:MAG TPA: hypothetical protein VIK55_13105 [Paludibacter sp.]